MRKPIIAGNWKMNKTPDEAVALVNELKPLVKDAKCDVVVCVPAVCFAALRPLLKRGTKIKLGAQNVHFAEKGAYTGEVSAAMLESMEIDYCIVGHSERRAYYGETDEIVARKVDQLLKHNLRPIVCCGEVLEEREGNRQFDVVKKQITDGLFHLSADEFSNVVIAYEPVWAIGTGKTATPDQAQEMHAFIRNLIAEKYGDEVAENTSILYGGSCKPGNAKELFANKDVDGGLIGGASLKADDFLAIATA